MDQLKNPPSEELYSKAEILKATELFSDDLNARRGILLVLAGEKPVATVTSGHWQETDTGRTRVADDPSEVAAFLDQLGLVHQLRPDQYGTDATIAQSAEVLEEYERAAQAGDHEAIGRLYGYPATAVDAFVHGDLLDAVEAEKLIAEAGLTQPAFGLSAGHYREELEFLKRQQSILAQYGQN